MAFDQTYTPSTAPELTLVDIEELRKILGAAADLDADTDREASYRTRFSTCMCPSGWVDDGNHPNCRTN